MKRRHFLRTAVAAGTAEAISPGFATPKEQASSPPEETAGRDPSFRLAGYTLPQLRELYHRDLFVDWLPFMERHVIDPEYGGFLCDTGIDGAQAGFDKDPLFEGRGIWVYSYLYTHFGKDLRHLDVARRSVELLAKSQPDGDMLWCSKIARDGSPSGPPGATVPVDLGIAEGLAAYAQATGRQEYLDRAKQLLSKCIQAYDRPDYYPNVGHLYFGPSAPSLPGARILGTWMLLLRTCAQILEIDQDADLDRLSHRCTDGVIQHHFNPGFQLNNELLDHDFSIPAGDYSQLANLGNSFEITWMLLDEALRRHDEPLFKLSADRFQRHAAVAWDQVYDGVFHILQNVDGNSFRLDKLLWAQEEVLTDSLFIFQHTRAAWAADLFSRMYGYLRESFPLQAHGSPLWMYATGRKATYEEFASLPKRIENYHHPRQLMLNLRRLEEMIRRNNGSNSNRGYWIGQDGTDVRPGL